MKTGDIIEIAIESVAFGGDGIGRQDGQVVFVPFTVDGDLAQVEIVEVRKRYARGRLKEIRVPSIHRTEPLCREYTRCGGCCYQHIAYAHQLVLKQQQIHDAFTRIGGIAAPPIKSVIASPQPYHYRLKADFHILNRKGGQPAIGFMSGATHRIVDIPRCEIVDESINRQLETYRQALSGQGKPKREDRITLWSMEGAEDTAPCSSTRPPFITRMIKGFPMVVPADGFFQANQFLIETMINQVIAAADLQGTETIIEGFSGSGLFTLFLAPLAGFLHTIEGDRQAVQAARKNLEEHGRTRVSLHEGDVARVLKDCLIETCEGTAAMIVDPPRTGCGNDLLEQMIRLCPSRIVYISCNPATQARDIQCLSQAGYLLSSLHPLDMFPQTAHIEVIAVLSLPG